MTPVAFAALSALGAVARWQLTRLNTRTWAGGTLAANLGASFVLGLLATTSATTLTVLGVGLLGSYSTFSTVMRETIDIADAATLGRAIGYLAATVALGVGAVLVGLELGGY